MESSAKRPAEDATEEEPASKKPRNGNDDTAMEESEEDDNVFADAPSPQEQDERHSGLSKFVQRMLDPNRKPRGLIEPPKVIPLNDEFLQAFGQREKKFDSQVGRSSEFDQTIQDDDGDEDAVIDASMSKQKQQKQDQDDQNSRKIKVVNLKYTTTEEKLRAECLNFGAVEQVTMPMDESNLALNVGRAYVIFERPEAAQSAVDQQLGGNLDGRPIRVSLAGEAGPNKSGGGKDEKRYWQKDISTKCRRCGQVGHIEAECNNQEKANICPLCAAVNQHEMRQCPLNRVCFNCGIPGHINRECTVPRGSQPPRIVCTICCGSGHSRFQCQRSASNVAGIQSAICLVCGKRGHFMCQELKWFFGLEGVFCYNCGGKGHVGEQCQRPTFDDLNRNEGWTIKEVERGQEYKLADEMELQRAEQERQDRERQRKRQEERDRNRNRYRERDRARSAPPQRPQGDYYNDFTNSHNQYNNNGNEYRYNIDDNNNNNRGYQRNGNSNNNNRGYRNNNNNNNRQTSGGRRRGYR